MWRRLWILSGLHQTFCSCLWFVIRDDGDDYEIAFLTVLYLIFFNYCALFENRAICRQATEVVAWSGQKIEAVGLWLWACFDGERALSRHL